MPRKTDRYNDKLKAADQIDMEEQIAALLFDHEDIEISEDTASDLGRQILLVVLKKFRPEMFG